MSSQDTDAMLQVPTKLTSAEAARLKEMLDRRRGQPVALDFTPVRQVGIQCLQVLLAACAAWTASGQHFEIRNIRADVRDGLKGLGLSPAQIGAPEAMHDT